MVVAFWNSFHQWRQMHAFPFLDMVPIQDIFFAQPHRLHSTTADWSHCLWKFVPLPALRRDFTLIPCWQPSCSMLQYFRVWLWKIEETVCRTGFRWLHTGPCHIFWQTHVSCSRRTQEFSTGKAFATPVCQNGTACFLVLHMFKCHLSLINSKVAWFLFFPLKPILEPKEDLLVMLDTRTLHQGVAIFWRQRVRGRIYIYIY